jgi:hypothetical protein
LQFGEKYTSPVLSTGTHTVQFKHVNGEGTYIDVDALEIK